MFNRREHDVVDAARLSRQNLFEDLRLAPTCRYSVAREQWTACGASDSMSKRSNPYPAIRSAAAA